MKIILLDDKTTDSTKSIIKQLTENHGSNFEFFEDLSENNYRNLKSADVVIYHSSSFKISKPKDSPKWLISFSGGKYQFILSEDYRCVSMPREQLYNRLESFVNDSIRENMVNYEKLKL